MHNDDMFNTGWDPYTSLLACEHNIGQLVSAVQQGSDLIKQVTARLSHQQEVIQQLTLQNQRLMKNIESIRHQMILQDTQIKLLLAKQDQ